MIIKFNLFSPKGQLFKDTVVERPFESGVFDPVINLQEGNEVECEIRDLNNETFTFVIVSKRYFDGNRGDGPGDPDIEYDLRPVIEKKNHDYRIPNMVS